MATINHSGTDYYLSSIHLVLVTVQGLNKQWCVGVIHSVQCVGRKSGYGSSVAGSVKKPLELSFCSGAR